MLLQAAYGLHNFFPVGFPQPVVRRGVGVTQGHQWIIRPEIHDDAKTSPFIVQQDAVGLQAVGDDFVTTVTLLELDHLCKNPARIR